MQDNDNLLNVYYWHLTPGAKGICVLVLYGILAKKCLTITGTCRRRGQYWQKNNEIPMKEFPAHLKRMSTWIILITITSLGFNVYLKPDSTLKDVLLFLHFFIIIYLFRKGFFKRGLKFDTHFFYYNDLHRIPMSSIHSVKLTNVSDLHNNPFWTVRYFTDEEQSVRVLPSLTDDNFERFLQAVKVANPSVDTDIFEFKLYDDWLPKISWRRKTKS